MWIGKVMSRWEEVVVAVRESPWFGPNWSAVAYKEDGPVGGETPPV